MIKKKIGQKNYKYSIKQLKKDIFKTFTYIKWFTILKYYKNQFRKMYMYKKI